MSSAFSIPAYETLKVEPQGDHVLLVTLNRPEVLNAINTQMGHDLLDLWTRLTVAPANIRCAVLTGAGDRAFCAGGDLKQRDGMTDRDWRLQHAIFEEAYYAVMECPVPVIAAVNGAAYAGGCELALACDFIYAASGVKFALSEVAIGIMPGGGGTQNLPRAVGERRAKELIMCATPFTAEQAARWGMVNEVFPQAELMDRVQDTAQRLAGNAPISVRQAKKSIHHGLQMDLRNGLMFEVQAYDRMISTEDRQEGIRAFNEKRKPVFRGC